MAGKTDAVAGEGYLKEKYHYFHLRDTAGQERDFHFHEFNKIVFLIAGHVDYAVENSIYSLAPGDLLLVRHHAIHKAIIDKSVPYERVIIYLDEAFFSSLLPDAVLTESFVQSDRSGNYLIRPNDEQLRQIRNALDGYEAATGSEKTENALRETFVMQLLLRINSMMITESARTLDAHDEKIEKVLTYINENLTGSLEVEELAHRAYMSRYHFMRVFREKTGMTVHGYVVQRKLLNASRLMREGIPAADAAARSGFSDYSAFYRAFRSAFGISPSSLRKQTQSRETGC